MQIGANTDNQEICNIIPVTCRLWLWRRSISRIERERHEIDLNGTLVKSKRSAKEAPRLERSAVTKMLVSKTT